MTIKIHTTPAVPQGAAISFCKREVSAYPNRKKYGTLKQ